MDNNTADEEVMMIRSYRESGVDSPIERAVQSMLSTALVFLVYVAGVAVLSRILGNWSREAVWMVITGGFVACATAGLIWAKVSYNRVAESRSLTVRSRHCKPRILCLVGDEHRSLFENIRFCGFEPVIFKQGSAIPGSWLPAIILRYHNWYLLLTVATVCALMNHNIVAGATAVALFVLFFRGPTWVRPTYLRISPGLAEELVGWWFSDAVDVKRTIHLDTLAVTIRTDVGVAEFYADQSRASVVDRLWLGLLDDPVGSAVAIARAAGSTALVQSLPSNSLLG